MVRKLVVRISVTQDDTKDDLVADIDISGQHNGNMLNALLAQVMITKDLIMKKITETTKEIYNASDTFKPNKPNERNMN